LNRRQQQGYQNPDDRDYDQQFDECKALLGEPSKITPAHF
jgi:hypothetical protein